jgi:hypothetical protein
MKVVQSGCVVPVENNDIIMKSEVVNIYLYSDHYQVEVNYVFVNAGSAQKVMMGFPDDLGGPSLPTWITDFMAYDGDKFVPYSTLYNMDTLNYLAGLNESGKKCLEFLKKNYSSFNCFQIDFAEKQIKKIRNTYSQKYQSEYIDTIRSAMYVLITGSLWKDDIDSITVNVIPKGIPMQYLKDNLAYFPYKISQNISCRHQNIQGIRFKPGTPEVLKDTFRFQYLNTEPDFNFEISVTKPFINGIKFCSEQSHSWYNDPSRDLLSDNDPYTAWIRSFDSSRADTISLNFSPYTQAQSGSYEGVFRRVNLGAYKISQIGIINGYACDSAHFYSYSRAKKIKIFFLNMTDYDVMDNHYDCLHNISQYLVMQKEITLKDNMDMQYIDIEPSFLFNNINFVIEEVYPGSTYSDTGISEIQFFPEN